MLFYSHNFCLTFVSLFVRRCYTLFLIVLVEYLIPSSSFDIFEVVLDSRTHLEFVVITFLQARGLILWQTQNKVPLKSVYFQAITGLNVMRGMTFVPRSQTRIPILLLDGLFVLGVMRDLCCYLKYSDYRWILFFIKSTVECLLTIINRPINYSLLQELLTIIY